MALLDEILNWMSGRPAWQQDAARRLFQTNSNLSSNDFDELYKLLKAEHGLPNEGEIEPIPLSQKHLPIDAASGDKVVLHSISNLRLVNRIAQNQSLTFAPQGITIIYGANGSGKSGYARVLKHACRARDQEKIHKDVTLDEEPSGSPSATFEIEVAGKPDQINWKYDEPPPDLLSTIALFDTRCARYYLTEHDVAYLPYGLDILENLAQSVLPELSKKLKGEIASINQDKTPFAHLIGETIVGVQIKQLSAKSNKDYLEKLGNLSPEEIDELTRLEKALGESDPATKAQLHKNCCERLEGLIKKLQEKSQWVSDSAIKRLKKLTANKTNAENAENEAAQALRSKGNILPGTGDQIWKDLFESARKYSTVAYPDHPFPYTGNGAVCPLCQNELDQHTKERLYRFERYIKNDVAKTAKDARDTLGKAIEKIQSTNLKETIDKATKTDLNALDDSLVNQVEGFCENLDARRTAMLKCIETQAWDDLPEIGTNPQQTLQHFADKELREHQIYQRAIDVNKKKDMTKKRNELSARQGLSKVLPAVLTLLENLQLVEKLRACEKGLNSGAISKEAKLLASPFITEKLSNAFEKELDYLKLNIKLHLQERSSHGEIYHQLILKPPSQERKQLEKIPLGEVFSESEQRVISLGAFLAEVSLANHKCGIIFDDPVSSLDHYRCKEVAKRLVDEAAHRQVIVFTHDAIFLTQLNDAIKEAETCSQTQYLEWIDGQPGGVFEEPPWEYKSFDDRVNKLKKVQRQLARDAQPYPDVTHRNKIREQYRLLRNTIEQMVQDLILNGVVRRFDDWVQVKRLNNVVGFSRDEYESIKRLYKKCHEFAHDISSSRAEILPSVTDLGKDIDELERQRKSIAQRIKKQRNLRNDH